jgi:GNAT superfamily N-acetyltransferase
MDFDPSYLAVKTPALSLECIRVPNDEETFGAPIACLNLFEVRDCVDAIHDYQVFCDWCNRTGIMLCSTRIKQSRIAHSMFLEDRGFRFVELNYLPSLDNLQCEKVPYSEIEIKTATVADRGYLASLAEQGIQIGRFHHDPRVNSSAANRRYGQWVRRAFDNPKQRVLTCVCASQIVAFFVVETPGSTDRFWSLIGFGQEFTGRGLGYATWNAMLRHHQAEGVKKITTSISSHNIAAMNLYSKLGFRFSEPLITLHWHSQGSGILGQ